MEPKISVRETVIVSIFTALTILGGYIAIPLGPVSMVLSNFVVLLSGLLLGSKRGSAVAFTYLLLGTLGLPVFAGGTSGIAHILGPTGGYLLGYIPAAFVTGLISEYKKRSLTKDVLALISGVICIYALGIPWLKISLDMSWTNAISAGMLPFLAGDAVKIIAASIIAIKMHEPIQELLNKDNHNK